MSFHFVLFYVCRSCLHLLFVKIYFIFLVACGIKLTNTFFRSYQAPRLWFSPGDDYEIYFWGRGPKKATHLDDFTER